MQLNLPVFDIKTRKTADGKAEVFDTIRKKYVALTPEEWVRQHFMNFLVCHKQYPASLIGIEKGLKLNQMQKRFDAVVFDKNGKPLVLIEFKSPDVDPDQKTFDQISRYNLIMQVNYLIVSNGLKHYCCRMDYQQNQYSFLKSIPSFHEL